MPLHKNVERLQATVIKIKGTQTRQTSALTFTIEDGGINNYFSNVPVIGYTESTIAMKFGGGDYADRGKITSKSGVDDAWYVNWPNVEAATHEYTDVVTGILLRDTLNNLSWFNYTTGLNHTAVALGSWAVRTATDDLGDTIQEVYFIPDSSAGFYNAHPGTLNGDTTHYVDVGELVTGGLSYDTNFEPESAILDEAGETITLGVVSANSLMDTNVYWQEGRVHGTASTGNDVPAWEGTVISNTTSGSNTTIVLRITSGLTYLVAKELTFRASESTDNSIFPLFEENVEKHFLVHRNTIELHILDNISSTNQSYTFSEDWTEEDIYGDVQTGVGDYSKIDVNVTAVSNVFNQRMRLTNIPTGTVSPTVTQVWLIHHTGNDVTTNGPKTILFVRIPFDNDTPLQTLTKGAALLTALSLNDVNVVCTVSGTDNDATMTMRPRLSLTADFTGTTVVQDNWTTSISTGTVVAPILLTLENDPNRVGDKTGITFFTDDWEDTDPTEFISFARGTTGTLAKGFKWNLGAGYRPNNDGKDVTINAEGIDLSYSGNEKGVMWDSEVLTGGSQTVLATEQNPFTLNLKDSFLNFGNFDLNAGSNVSVAGRTFIMGSAGAFTRKNHIINLDNVVIGVYNVRSLAIFYSTLGKKKNVTLILDTDSGGILNAPSTLTPTLTGIRVVVNCDIALFRDSGNSIGTTNTQAFARDFNSLLFRINAQLEGTGVIEGARLRGYNPQSVNFGYINYTVGGKIYGLDADIGETIHTWTNRGAGGAGGMQYGVLYNPKYQSEGEDGALTDIYQEIYYNNESETTLVPVKEGCERNAIGTIGENLHPFVSGVTISDSFGLADARINSAGVNNFSAGEGFIDDTANYSGLVLIYARQVVNSTSPSQVSTADENNVTLYAKNYFSVVKRDGHRPLLINKKFDDDLDTLESTVLFRKDKYWQANTVAAIDSYVSEFDSSLWSIRPTYDSVNNVLSVYIPESSTWNQVYRFIEYCENQNLITNANLASETRPFDTINGRFRRFIDNDNPVTVDGQINMSDYSLKVTVNGSITRSTNDNGIEGVDLGTTNTLEFVSVGTGDNKLEGNLTFKSISFDETFNDLRIDNSTLNNNDDQDYTIAVANSSVNSTGAPTFSELTSSVIVTTNSTTTVTAAATAMATKGTGAISISANVTNCNWGTSSVKTASITFTASVVSVNNTGYATGDIKLSNNDTDGFWRSSAKVIPIGSGATWTDCDVEATIEINTQDLDGGNYKSPIIDVTGSTNGTTLDGADIDVSANTVGGEIKNATLVDIVGNSSSTKITASTTINIDGNYDGGALVAPTVTVDGTSDNCDITATVQFDGVGLAKDGNINANISTFANGTQNVIVGSDTSATVTGGVNGGSVTSPTVSVSSDLSNGGLINSAGNVSVRDILGATSTIYAGKLTMRNLEAGFVTLSGLLSTITSIRGGTLTGTVADRTLTTTGQILGGTFVNNIKLLSVPTNTDSTRHIGVFGSATNVMKMAMTNAGSIQFSITEASGNVSIDTGPSSGTAIVFKGAVIMDKVDDNGTNNTDDVEFAAAAFTFNVNRPSGLAAGDLQLETASGTQISTTILTQNNSTRLDVISYALRYVGPLGFAMKTGTFIVPNIAENGSDSIDLTLLFNDYPRTSENPQAAQPTVTVSTYANSILPMVATNVVQNGPYMNKLLCEAVGASDETFKALFDLEDDTWFGSDGSLTWWNANSDYIQMTSTTATTDPTGETIPYFRPTNSSSVNSLTQRAAQFKFGQGTYLGQSYDISPVTSVDVGNYVVGQLKRPIQKASIFADIEGSDFGADLE